MNSKTFKISIIVTIVCIIYLAFAMILLGIFRTTSGYIVDANLGSFYCKDKKCKKVNDDVVESKKGFAIYQYGKYVDDYILTNVANKWNFKKNEEYIAMYGDFVAIDKSLNFKFIDYSLTSLTVEDLELLEKNITVPIGYLDNSNKIIVDLDENGTDDEIYTLSNQGENNDSSNYFSILYIKLNGKLLKIHDDIKINSDNYSLPFYEIAAIIKIDKSVKIIVNTGYFSSVGESKAEMLTLNKNDITIETN